MDSPGAVESPVPFGATTDVPAGVPAGRSSLEEVYFNDRKTIRIKMGKRNRNENQKRDGGVFIIK
jgi:hypothetical protein